MRMLPSRLSEELDAEGLGVLEIKKSSKTLEGLSWYEIVSKLGLLSFNTQGNKPIELIAKLARISNSSKVLIVGCGAGGTALHLAETTGATVYGIDLSPESIRTANALLSKSPAREKMHFQIGDANALSFPSDSFDVVITEFMAFFLEQSAFEGFFSVLRCGGQIALAELMKDPKVNAKADAKILEAEQAYSAVLGYKFHIPVYTDYVEWLIKAGFEDIHLSERFSESNFLEKIREVGGWKNLFEIASVTLRLMLVSPLLREKFIQVGLVKRVLYQNRPTAKYIFQAILAGQKPNT
jgi:ubiquinone/menaquinone biosynthesis C-methylase UbiE